MQCEQSGEGLGRQMGCTLFGTGKAHFRMEQGPIDQGWLRRRW